MRTNPVTRQATEMEALLNAGVPYSAIRNGEGSVKEANAQRHNGSRRQMASNEINGRQAKTLQPCARLLRRTRRCGVPLTKQERAQAL